MTDRALLVIDMQEGNFSDPEPIYQGADLLTKVRSLIEKARSADVLIIYIQNCGETGDPDEPETSGWEIHSSIAPIEGEIVIQKGTPDSFHETPLRRELVSKRIKKLIIAGLQTEYCVDTTCRQAFSLGYEVTLVKDAHSTWDSSLLTAQQIIAHHNAVLAGFATLKEEKEIQF
ncbi:MAG: cysteine hydrolase family protein [Promethearchaeota archaeon]